MWRMSWRRRRRGYEQGEIADSSEQITGSGGGTVSTVPFYFWVEGRGDLTQRALRRGRESKEGRGGFVELWSG